MFQRKALYLLQEWSKRSDKTALLVTGARQIGKSFLVEHLGRTQFKNMVEFNLYENKTAKHVLSEAADAQDLITRIGSLAEHPLIPGETLIFIDEIQEAPDLMTMVKFLVQDGRYAYAFSGSMLGVELKNIRSYPVGFVTEVAMYPMDFEEFCWAAGASTEALETAVQCCLELRPVPNYLHERLLSFFRSYLAVGGMPAAIQRLIDSKWDLMSVREVQQELVTAYLNDIMKYAGRDAPNVRAILEQLPLQLDAKSVRFKLNSLGPETRYESVRSDFNWLTLAHVALKCNIVQDPHAPLKLSEKPSSFKLYESDTGMLVGRFPASMTRALYLDVPETNLGLVYENAFAQALTSCGQPLFYYMNRKRGEVDFMLENDKGDVVPIEVKSGRAPRAHAALDRLLTTEGFGIPRGYVFSRLNVELDEKVVYLPWYALLCLPEVLGIEPVGNGEESFRIQLPRI